MTTYSVSPDLFRNNKGFDDEYDDWLYGCFKSKWNHRKEYFDDEDESSEQEPIEHREFDPNILKQD